MWWPVYLKLLVVSVAAFGKYFVNLYFNVLEMWERTKKDSNKK
ncbi:MAG TPA: hypothetical protein PLX35_04575 [Cyclobacteriaceae bacterium]|nr:hypothetical protein [Cyclobacteriaceae bacterium]